MESLRVRMMRGFGRNKPPLPPPDETGDTMDVYRKEEILRNLLNPMESYIMRLQSILIWEKPQQSAGLLIGVNGLFWLATTLRFYYLIGMTGFFVVFLERWTNYIWPEIRVPPPPDQDTEGWTPVHPNLMSVPEICQHLAEWWDYVSGYVDWYIRLRQTNHLKFFLLTMLMLCSTATFGHYVSGYYILYFTVMGALLLPCALYHNVVQHMFEKIQPYISQFEDRLHIKRKKKTKGKRKSRGEQQRDDDSSSDEIEEFVPSPDPGAVGELELAVTEPESEEEKTGHTPRLLTPAGPSPNPSREHSDIEMDEEHAGSGDLTSLTAGLASIPDFDANLEDSQSDLREHLPGEADLRAAAEEQSPAAGDTTTGGSAEPIQFVSSHFKDDSSEDDEAQLEEGLAFPDVQALSPEPPQSKPIQTLASAFTSPLVTETVSSLMTSTVAGLSSFKDTVAAAARGVPGNGANSNNQEPSLQTSVDTDTLEAEFEFLDQQDLDSLDVEGDEIEK